jgi:CRISPR system Cascade subunit CasD
MKTILMKFAGPLQSWGTKSHFETRGTDRYPSKSAVIGMIAAALGYRRYEDEKLKQLQKLSFAVRIDQPGSLLRDYQIATKYKANGDKDRSYVTERYYLQDAVFVVAVGSEDEQLMTTIWDALQHPYFQLYLGRRSNSINMDYLLKMVESSVISSIKAVDWQAADWYQHKNTRANGLDIYADDDLINSSYYTMVRDIPESFSQGKRDGSPFSQYDRRTYRLRAVGNIKG